MFLLRLFTPYKTQRTARGLQHMVKQVITCCLTLKVSKEIFHSLQRARVGVDAIFALTYIQPSWRLSVHTCYYRDERWRWWWIRHWKMPWESFPAITHWTCLLRKNSPSIPLFNAVLALRDLMRVWTDVGQYAGRESVCTSARSVLFQSLVSDWTVPWEQPAGETKLWLNQRTSHHSRTAEESNKLSEKSTVLWYSDGTK